ncbi:dihydroorotase [Tsuneonella deserti]|uniref:Dihydroorotase n=1 Tax=Tsuneonella deserti TaxID=2035528 RepID=A0ABQ1S026_9SPHN|nr:dihydroorotase [Tsuneonella deserti]GGD88776.1 dihydroorotase [Tsuneonella deserti]
MAESLTIRRPDDWHVHLRDGDMLRGVAPWTARQFGRAIVMPNLTPPVTTTAMARAYRERILAALPADADFEPLMTAYLTDDSDPADLAAGKNEGVLVAAKLYPANATTNSAHGVSDIARLDPVFAAMEESGLVLCVHGEVTDPEIDIFDREAVFIERHLERIVRRFPRLRVVLEHVTTEEGVAFVQGSGNNVAGTITPQHLHLNRNAMLVGGMRPHAYCLPVAKREKHRLALRKAATSGSGEFFLGTDSAPHARGDKESACGCAGIFNAPFALESYLQVFEDEDALGNFESFASLDGAAFYGLTANESSVTLVREDHVVPEVIDACGTPVVPFHAGETLRWRLASG